MLIKKFMNADGIANGNGGESPKKNTTPSIPRADVDFMDVAKAVATNWLDNPDITLRWKNSDAFNDEVQAYTDSLHQRHSTGSQRPSLTQTLVQLDELLDDAVAEVKIYITKKFKKRNAAAQYARYGIIKKGRAYRMSRDRNERRAALDLMVAAIATDGFGQEEYGTNFWKDMKTNYTAALDLAGNTASNVSEKVANKNTQKKAIKKVLNALLFVLKGNYPDTYQEMYRKWGWKKETY